MTLSMPTSTVDSRGRAIGSASRVEFFRGRSRLVGTLLTLVFLGCGSANAPSPFDGGARASREIQIVVESSTFNDATVWVISQSRQERVGRVSGMASASFRINWDSIQQLQFRIDLLAGQTYTTPAITVSPGERVVLTLREPLSASILSRTGR